MVGLGSGHWEVNIWLNVVVSYVFGFFCRSKIVPFKTKHLSLNSVIPWVQVINVLYFM